MVLYGLLLGLPAQAGERAGDWAWTTSAEDLGATFGAADLPTSGGTDLGLGTGDSAAVTLSFVFPFGGSSYTGLVVHSYGVVELSDTPGPRGSGSDCVDGSLGGAWLAPWWRDWDLDAGGSVQVKDFGTSAVVQWVDLVEGSSTNTMAFQVWLYDTGEVVFAYQDVWNGDAAISRGAEGASGLQDGTTAISTNCDVNDLGGAESTWFTPMGLRHFSDDVAVDDHADHRFAGEASGDEAGYAIASAGDVTGDGAIDLLIGAPGASVAYLVSADDSGELSLSDATATLTGGASDRLGHSVSGGQDVDGDGVPDALVGAPYADDGGTNAGGAWLVLGTSLSGPVDVADADAAWTGAGSSDFAGNGVAVLGDVDADGYADLLVGAPNEDGAASNSGAAYVLLGGPSLAGGDLGAAHATLQGESSADYAGYTVASAGDFDDDGHADLLVAAYGADGGGSNAGAVTLVGGADLATGTQSLADFDVGDGPTDDATAGLGLAGGEDLDGDGVPDALVGSTTYDSQSGAVHLLLGDQSWPSALSPADGLLTGSDGERLGQGLAGLDLGDDGPGLALGAYSNNDDGANSGRVWIVDLDDIAGANVSVADSARGSLGGPSDSAYLGRTLASGDFDGDGWTDLAAGAWGADGDESTSGAVFVVPGQPTWRDGDGDGFIAESLGGNDCDDDDAALSPGLADACDGVDEDCNGVVDDGFADTDGDGVSDCIDSEDCDGLDNDGDGDIDEDTPDTDGDGTCDALDSEDCDGLDNDGDGEIDEDFADSDFDGIADCQDVEECDGYDNDGDGYVDEDYPDTDGDGLKDCVDWESCDGLDNDGDGEVDEGHPDTDEDGIVDCLDTEDCDAVDNDGDGEIDEDTPDVDGDGTCDLLDTESCDGLDNDGDGEVDEDYEDADGDGLADCLDSEECDGLDNDGDGEVDEGYADTDDDGVADCVETEECDGVDNDGDGWVDEGYGDSDHDRLPDCLDGEECDGLDNDGDGTADAGYPDSDGDGAADCIDVEECDGVDNDGDTEIDEGFSDADDDGIPNCLDDTPFPIEYEEGPEDVSGGGCSAAAGGSPGALGLAVLLFGLGRRRRRYGGPAASLPSRSPAW